MSGNGSVGTERAAVRDVKLARAVLDMFEAGDRLETLLEEAKCNGWGKDDYEEDWPHDRVDKEIGRWSAARRAVQAALRDGDYWANDADDNDELRPE
jgi:hypothetical protein